MEAAPLHDRIARGPSGGRAHWVRAADGLRLRFGHWPAADPATAHGTIFLLPGRTEYVEKYGPVALEFQRRGFALLSIDWRGQGLAERLLEDPTPGHIGDFADYQMDLDAVIAAAEQLELPRPWFLLAHSMGGAIGLRRLTTPGHPFTAAAFSAPMWGIRLPLPLGPLAQPLARLISRYGPVAAVPPGMGGPTYVLRAAFHRNKLTRDPAMWAFMMEQLALHPELSISGPSFHWVSESLLECAELKRRPSPALPCYCSIGGNERIIDIAAVRARMARWPKGHLATIDETEHEVMMERPDPRRGFFDACAALFASA